MPAIVSTARVSRPVLFLALAGGGIILVLCFGLWFGLTLYRRQHGRAQEA